MFQFSNASETLSAALVFMSDASIIAVGIWWVVVLGILSTSDERS